MQNPDVSKAVNAGLVVTAMVIAVMLPDTTAASVSLLLLGGLLALAFSRYSLRIALSEKVRGRIAIATVALVAAYTFVPVFGEDLGFIRGDWAPQHVVLKSVVDHLRHFELPAWTHTLSTGDAPLDVYPSLTYLIAAGVAIVGGLDDYLPAVLVGIAVLAHTLIAINAARIALRMGLPASFAALAGVLLVLDLGSVSSGGVIGTIKYGLVHSAVSQAFFSFAVIAILDAIHKPRLRRSIAIWIWIALTTAAHPIGLLSVAFACASLLAVAACARDIPRRRSLAVLANVIIGAALAAVVWLPLGDRIIAYGQHFSDDLPDVGHWLLNTLVIAAPEGSFSLIVYLGFVGAITAALSRRATPIFVGAMIGFILLALIDAVYVWLDLAPSRFVARFGAQRLYLIARPFVFVAAAYLVWIIVAAVRARRERGSRSPQLVFAIGMAASVALRFGCQTANLYVAQARAYASETVRTAQPLVDWAAAEMAKMAPDRWGRAVFVEMEGYYSHVSAMTGLPAFQPGPIPVVLLRERISEFSPESLRRYNVRWVVTDDKPWNEPTIGDPKTERHAGVFKIREVPGWDGQFARVERGTGRAVVTRLDDDGVDVELRDTSEPALVALGMGYYPRWRATDTNGHAIPVYAYPATSTGGAHVLAAWLRPGVTRFRPDGPLPSDGSGRPLALAALLAAISITAIWSRPRWRSRLLRRIARLRRTKLPPGVRVVAIGVAAVGLVGWALLDTRGPDRALEVGHGARGTAAIELWTNEQWRACDYRRVIGQYQCKDRAIVADTISTVVNDEQAMWPYTAPAIAMFPIKGRRVGVRARMTRHLAGRYWLGSKPKPVEITIDGGPVIETSIQRVIDLPDGDHEVMVKFDPWGEPQYVTFVREDALQGDRSVPMAPATP